ncbi:hypothetical protein RI054_13g67280 [Pseudoscourfieldia marina]
MLVGLWAWLWVGEVAADETGWARVLVGLQGQAGARCCMQWNGIGWLVMISLWWMWLVGQRRAGGQKRRRRRWRKMMRRMRVATWKIHWKLPKRVVQRRRMQGRGSASVAIAAQHWQDEGDGGGNGSATAMLSRSLPQGERESEGGYVDVDGWKLSSALSEAEQGQLAALLSEYRDAWHHQVSGRTNWECIGRRTQQNG